MYKSIMADLLIGTDQFQAPLFEASDLLAVYSLLANVLVYRNCSYKLRGWTDYWSYPHHRRFGASTCC